MILQTYIIDAFTKEVFKGNPAGVVLLNEKLNPSTMQSIAGEINLSETAFLMRDITHPHLFSIRYFTPSTEVPFCGHATLAASKLALDRMGLPKVEFITHHQLTLSAVVEGDSIAMKFPLYPTEEFLPANALYEALGIHEPGTTRFAKDVNMLLIELPNSDELRGLKPDFGKLRAAGSFNNVIVTARSYDNEFDFYSRCFCPNIGIDEDPVTGAAHTVLAGYWSKKLGKKEMKAYQLSKRGGYMDLSIVGDTELKVKSDARIVLEGTMHI